METIRLTVPVGLNEVTLGYQTYKPVNGVIEVEAGVADEMARMLAVIAPATTPVEIERPTSSGVEE